MFGPGKYVPDPTEGIVDVKDLVDLYTCIVDKRHGDISV